jgi:quercetin dioxygenase-like cupin family protein
VAHTAFADLTSEVQVQPGAVVSRVMHRAEGRDVSVFAFDSGEGLSEHTASRPAIVQVLRGRLTLRVDDEDLEMTPGSWLVMETGTPHALTASEPTVMLLTMLPAT